MGAVAALLAWTPRQLLAQASFAHFDQQARSGDRLNVVFFGASLTWGANASDPQQTSYRAVVAQRLEAAYPAAHFKFFDAAIGGTNSQLGAFRLDRDVLRHQPDLVFLDFSANDDIYSASPETLASYEAIVRRIITEAHAPVVQVILPFKGDVERGSLKGFLRRDAHLEIAKAYHTAVGDAIELAQRRVKAGEAKLDVLWPHDGVHPGDLGYQLFADAAWSALQTAIQEKRACVAPPQMLHASTYLQVRRASLAELDHLPSGWQKTKPLVVSAFFDMLMSRWLDDEVCAAGAAAPAGGAAPLRLVFRGSMALLLGESTTKSGNYAVLLDGKPLEHNGGAGKGEKGAAHSQFDAGQFAKRVNGNAYLVNVLAEGLDDSVEHTLEIKPLLQAGEQLRLESVCVAGAKPEVRLAAPVAIVSSDKGAAPK
ncbi:MAG TPA: SGNH/GDSL hydrolase family protein [Pirellulales bacterium]|nr:SGNH/GDSL hydrolase family protein [Pirellulales bacterium]